MLASLLFGLCMISATARVMTVSIFASARKDSLEGCEEDPPDRRYSLRIVVPAALYTATRSFTFFLVPRSVSDRREAKNASSLQFISGDCAG